MVIILNYSFRILIYTTKNSAASSRPVIFILNGVLYFTLISESAVITYTSMLFENLMIYIPKVKNNV